MAAPGTQAPDSRIAEDLSRALHSIPLGRRRRAQRESNKTYKRLHARPTC